MSVFGYFLILQKYNRCLCTLFAGATPIDAAVPPFEEPQLQNNLLVDGAAWLVKEMTTATSIDDANSRAARVLETIIVRVGGEVAEGFRKVSLVLL